MTCRVWCQSRSASPPQHLGLVCVCAALFQLLALSHCPACVNVHVGLRKKHKLMPNWFFIGRVARSQITRVIVAFAFNFVFLLLNIIDPQNKILLFYSMLNSKLANLEMLCAEPPLYWHIYVFISNFSPLYILRYFAKSPQLCWAFQVRANCTLNREALSTHMCLVVT